MSVATKLAAFAAVVLGAFGLGFGVGDLAGPFGDAPTSGQPAHDDHQRDDQ